MAELINVHLEYGQAKLSRYTRNVAELVPMHLEYGRANPGTPGTWLS